MKNTTTDELIANVLAIHLEVKQHQESRQHRITPLQVKVLADAVTSINRFLIAWQTQAMPKRKVVG